MRDDGPEAIRLMLHGEAARGGSAPGTRRDPRPRHPRRSPAKLARVARGGGAGGSSQVLSSSRTRRNDGALRAVRPGRGRGHSRRARLQPRVSSGPASLGIDACRDRRPGLGGGRPPEPCASRPAGSTPMRAGRFTGRSHGVPIGLRTSSTPRGSRRPQALAAPARRRARGPARACCAPPARGRSDPGEAPRRRSSRSSDPAVTAEPLARVPDARWLVVPLSRRGGSSHDSRGAGSQTLGSVLPARGLLWRRWPQADVWPVSRRGVVPLSWSLDHVASCPLGGGRGAGDVGPRRLRSRGSGLGDRTTRPT